MPDPYEIICSSTDREPWLAARAELAAQGYLSASSVGPWMGLTSWAGPWSIWAQATGYESRKEADGRRADRLQLGLDLEPIVIKRALRSFTELGVTVDIEPWPYLCKSTRFPLFATMDARIRYKGHCPDGEPCNGWAPWYPFELKTWDPFARDQWKDGAPDYVKAQALAQAIVLGVDRCGVAVQFLNFKEDPSVTWPLLELGCDPERWGAKVLGAAARFCEAVTTDTPPTPTGADLAMTAQKDTEEDEPVLLTGEDAEKLEERIYLFRYHKEAVKEHDDCMFTEQAGILALMAGHRAVLLPDGTQVRRKMRLGKPCANGAIEIIHPEEK